MALVHELFDTPSYMTWYGCAARIAPFFSAARYTISPLFLRKLYISLGRSEVFEKVAKIGVGVHSRL